MPRPRSRIRYSPLLERAADLAKPRSAVPHSVARLTSRAIPSVDPWLAGEMFVSPHVEERRRGFAILVGSEAARRSALTQHLLASRIDEADAFLRAQIVQALCDYFEVRGREYRYPPEIRAAVADYLRRYDHPHILCLLEAWLEQGDGELLLRTESVSRLLERIPNASQHLTRLVGDKTVALNVRRAAVELIGQVGFTDAVSVLEGLEARIEGRRAGQLAMFFAPADHHDEEALLPALKATLQNLKDAE